MQTSCPDLEGSNTQIVYGLTALLSKGVSRLRQKMFRQFSGIHRKVSTTSLCNVREGHQESLCEYPNRYSEATIKVEIPNPPVKWVCWSLLLYRS